MQKTASRKRKAKPTAITEPVADPGRLDEEGRDWINETPVMWYELNCWEQAHGVVQTIMVSLEEYEKLKVELARMRGFAPAEVENAA